MKMRIESGLIQTTLRLVGLLTLFPSAAVAAPPLGLPEGWSDGFAYANGVRLHYYRAAPAPGKPVIVMCHGYTDNGLCWARLAGELQGKYDIFMLDTRGHGLSDPLTSADDGDTLQKDVVDFVRTMKFEKPILVGHSMGAATVMRIGADHPELARAVVMLDPILGRMGPPRATTTAPDPKAAPGGKSAPVPAQRSGNRFGDPAGLVAGNNQSFDDLVARGRRENPKWDIVDIQYWALAKRQYHGPYSEAQGQALFGTMAIGDSLRRITVPAVILKADASPEGRKANEEIAKTMRRGKLVHIDGGGHNLHHDELGRTVKVLTEFLSTL